jgi:hypothetical protein
VVLHKCLISVPVKDVWRLSRTDPTCVVSAGGGCQNKGAERVSVYSNVDSASQQFPPEVPVTSVQLGFLFKDSSVVQPKWLYLG